MANNQEPIRTLKGIGEKTGKLFEKLGVYRVADLLMYYPRAYHIYEPPVSIRELREDTIGAVGGILQKNRLCQELSAHPGNHRIPSGWHRKPAADLVQYAFSQNHSPGGNLPYFLRKSYKEK